MYCYSCVKILSEKNVKKNLGKLYYLILFYLISLHESLNNVNEYVNRGAKPEPELYSLPTSSLLSAPPSCLVYFNIDDSSVFICVLYEF